MMNMKSIVTKYIEWQTRSEQRQKKFLASLMRFFLPDEEITIKPFFDNARTVAMSSTLLFFHAKFVGVNAQIPNAVCSTFPIFCHVRSQVTDSDQLQVWILILLPLLIQGYAYFMLTAGVLQSWCLYIRVALISDTKGPFAKNDSELEGFWKFLYRKFVTYFTMAYSILATATGAATLFYSSISRNAP